MVLVSSSGRPVGQAGHLGDHFGGPGDVGQQQPGVDRVEGATWQPGGRPSAVMTCRRPGWNRSAMRPAKGANSGGTACANSSNPTAAALPAARCTCKIKAVVAIASPSGQPLGRLAYPVTPGPSCLLSITVLLDEPVCLTADVLWLKSWEHVGHAVCSATVQGVDQSRLR
jgi:hypothetical protein